MRDGDLWATPPDVYAEIESRFGPFLFDAAANAANRKCPFWLGPGGLREDCLVVPWDLGGDAWLNPPYSCPYPFVRKAREEARLGNCSTTLLLPSTTEVAWFREFVYRGSGEWRAGVDVEFWPRRIRFIDPTTGQKGGQPKFGSVVVRFRRGEVGE